MDKYYIILGQNGLGFALPGPLRIQKDENFFENILVLSKTQLFICVKTLNKFTKIWDLISLRNISKIL